MKKDEDIENNRYALAYAASKYFNTTETGNKQIDKYILQMQQKYDKIIQVINMTFEYNNKKYEVVIEKKNNKNDRDY